MEDLCEINMIHQDVVNRVEKNMPEDGLIYDLAELFKIFGDSTRIRILFVLFEAEVCVCDLAQVLNMKQAALMNISANLLILYKILAHLNQMVLLMLF